MEGVPKLNMALEQIVKDSQLVVDFLDKPEEFCSIIDSEIGKFLTADEAYKSSSSKDIYVELVYSIAVLHFSLKAADAILSVNDISDERFVEMKNLRDELNNLLTAQDAAIVFTEDDRDVITIGKYVAMTLYYSGNKNDPNAVIPAGENFPLSINKAHAPVIVSKKSRNHINKTRHWHRLS